MATFGKTIIGTSYFHNGANYTFSGSKYTLPESGNISKLTLYIRGFGDVVVHAAQLAIYDAMFNRLAVTEIKDLGSGTDLYSWFDFQIVDANNQPTTVALQPGDYWLCWISTGDIYTQYDADPNPIAQTFFNMSGNISTGFPPNIASTYKEYAARNASVYATYASITPTSPWYLNIVANLSQGTTIPLPAAGTPYEIPYNTPQQVDATPYTGFHFLKWIFDAVEAGTISSITTGPYTDGSTHNLEAIFEADTPIPPPSEVFGKTSVGAVLFYKETNTIKVYKMACKYNNPSAGIFSTIYVRLTNIPGWAASLPIVKMGIVDEAGTLRTVSVSAQLAPLPAGRIIPQLTEFTLTSPTALPAGNYWLVLYFAGYGGLYISEDYNAAPLGSCLVTSINATDFDDPVWLSSGLVASSIDGLDIFAGQPSPLTGVSMTPNTDQSIFNNQTLQFTATPIGGQVQALTYEWFVDAISAGANQTYLFDGLAHTLSGHNVYCTCSDGINTFSSTPITVTISLAPLGKWNINIKVLMKNVAL